MTRRHNTTPPKPWLEESLFSTTTTTENSDIFFANGANIHTLVRIPRNITTGFSRTTGKVIFTDVTEKAGLAGTGYDIGVAIGDYDNDGFEDIFVAGVHRNTLYHNNGDGTFTDVTAKAGLNKPDPEYGPLWSVGAVWVDVNNDGLLDLFVVNYLQVGRASTNPFAEHDGHRDYCHPKMYKPTPTSSFSTTATAHFEDVSAESGLRAYPGKGMGAAMADFDLDGKMDLFVANDKLVQLAIPATAAGNSRRSAFEANVALREDGVFISGMGVDFRDIDNDGYPDIFLVALDNETFPIYRNTGQRRFRRSHRVERHDAG